MGASFAFGYGPGVFCGIIVLLMVVPYSPAALNAVEWGIVANWVVLGLLLRLLSGRRVVAD